MIKFIKPDNLLSLRNEVLRQGQLSLDECRFATDEIWGAFHLGYYDDAAELVSIASLFPQNYNDFTGKGYQLRGMATAVACRGRGIGTRLLSFAIVYLRGQGAGYLWCNARKKALKFYSDSGFKIISAEFEVDGIGPHCVMYLKIQ